MSQLRPVGYPENPHQSPICDISQVKSAISPVDQWSSFICDVEQVERLLGTDAKIEDLATAIGRVFFKVVALMTLVCTVGFAIAAMHPFAIGFAVATAACMIAAYALGLYIDWKSEKPVTKLYTLSENGLNEIRWFGLDNDANDYRIQYNGGVNSNLRTGRLNPFFVVDDYHPSQKEMITNYMSSKNFVAHFSEKRGRNSIAPGNRNPINGSNITGKKDSSILSVHDQLKMRLNRLDILLDKKPRFDMSKKRDPEEDGFAFMDDLEFSEVSSVASSKLPSASSSPASHSSKLMSDAIFDDPLLNGVTLRLIPTSQLVNRKCDSPISRASNVSFCSFKNGNALNDNTEIGRVRDNRSSTGTSSASSRATYETGRTSFSSHYSSASEMEGKRGSTNSGDSVYFSDEGDDDDRRDSWNSSLANSVNSDTEETK